MIPITLNGAPYNYPGDDGASLEDLVQSLGLKPQEVVVEQNGSLHKDPTLKAAILTANDTVEVIHFIGGGSPTFVVE